MSLKRSKKADLPPLILSDMLFPNSIPVQSVGAISVQGGLRLSLAADQIKVFGKIRNHRHKLMFETIGRNIANTTGTV
jgi:hypothetical protein